MGKQAVFINVDETSISLARPDLKGNIVPRGQHLQPIRHPAVSSASDFEQHTCCESEAGQIVVAPAAGNSAIGTGQDWLEYSCFLRRVFENASRRTITVAGHPTHPRDGLCQPISLTA